SRPDMSPDEPANPEAEQPARPSEQRPSGERLASQLRDSLRRRRLPRLMTFLILVLLIGAPVALLLWLIRSGPEEPPVRVTAFDQLTLPGEAFVCRAQLSPADPARPEVRLEGRELSFELTTLTSVGKPERAKSTTAADGKASVEWKGVPSRSDVIVRHSVPGQRGEAQDRARVFAWPRATKVLLVDVAALTEAGAELWEQEKVASVPPAAGAAEALQQAQKAKYAIAYLAVGAERSAVYQQVRNWVERQAVALNGPLPDGPVLGLLSGANPATGSEAPRQILAVLKRFAGPHTVLVGRPEEGEAYREAGLKVLTVAPGGQAWAKVVNQLPR
ncbi:MAG: hypothetical protein L0Z62_12305, partial [Gemmataceae bacterium]|nr:hypothetical protein [Gemmataceae bacterium]